MIFETAEDSKKLVNELEAATLLPKRGRSYKHKCQIKNTNKEVFSWKFNEWDYGKNNIKLPLNARGLFTLDDLDNPRIVARGYDKFFNINEVSTTKWDWLMANTIGPYEVTVKENGCIIFVSGLEDGSLVVCSKHSTGERDDTDRNHSIAGENFLKKQLESRGLDPRELGLALFNMNATAVAEYCDDSFEEHILEYTKDAAGLYLHGININKRIFQTLPMNEVYNFALSYGFKTIEFFTKHDISSLRQFLEGCANVGSYNNKEIEGFVVRCKLRDGSAFFFKFKFEEPYLMYRQWREATKKYITTKSRVFSFKKHRFITNKYLDFVIPILNSDPKVCEEYMRDSGIIRLRKMFLEDYGLTGMEILNSEVIQQLELQNAIDYNKVDENTKFLFFPIATIGCGKTTTALTIKNLFPTTWGHIQNDDITGKDKSMLMKKSLELLAKDDIKAVFTDRNNHQFRERKQLFEWFEELKEKYLPYDCNVKIIALSFLPYEDIDATSDLTIKRVMARGDKHQSIKVNSDGEKKVLGIMKGFLKRYQPVAPNREPDNMFDLVINLQVRDSDSSLINAKEILTELNHYYPVLVPSVPSAEDIKTAFVKSLQYTPTITKKIGKSNGSVNKSLKLSPSYFSANIEHPQSFIKTLAELVSRAEASIDVSPIFKALEENKAQPQFHITLCHVATGKRGTQRQRDIWCEFNKRYNQLLTKGNGNQNSRNSLLKTNDKVEFKMKSVVWDSSIVTAVVELPENCIQDGHTRKVVPHLSCANEIAHITVALLQPGVKPFYSNALCQKIQQEHNLEEGNFEDGTNCVTVHGSPVMESIVCINP
ncbi:LAQU0S02e06920g1_1 [Lachancea quebecensis]|uniref:tRNA ligase n=1 Tax=Lachancea quebecensis TaxID=1654605 RepID=A0A0P1KN21_9SACH|nr:LAQU0S02e06920g1_1 [Lachancea quebecensis]